MSESDAAKLVANIEMEMFNIFRNTDSKYMNKYRTIMFNIKDPKNMVRSEFMTQYCFYEFCSRLHLNSTHYVAAISVDKPSFVRSFLVH